MAYAYSVHYIFAFYILINRIIAQENLYKTENIKKILINDDATNLYIFFCA